MDVVVPAHNEESTITRCLDTISGATSVRHVIVVPNACHDSTARLATAHRARPTVVEIPIPGKAIALNLGDAQCREFPRAYLDADVEVSSAGIDLLAAALREPTSAWLAAPRRRVVTDHATALVQRYYRIRHKLPENPAATAGRGIYVLSAAAHAALFPLPKHVINDDGYVERLTPARLRVIVNTTVVIRAPQTMPILLRRQVRIHMGTRQLLDMRIAGTGATRKFVSVARLVLRLTWARKVGVLDAAVFLVVTLVVRAAVAAQRLIGRNRQGARQQPGSIVK
jgi:glycosyltransferase involved in cell wall biosynthesis